jgi:hypothetical protein
MDQTVAKKQLSILLPGQTAKAVTTSHNVRSNGFSRFIEAY